MSEVAPADRARLLRSKRTELSRIATSRKRKLRELWAVCDNEAPIPTTNLADPDAPLTSAAEAHFLNVSDILQDRLFDESNLPTRRQLRSDSSKSKASSRKSSLDGTSTEPSRKAAKVQRDGSRPRKSRATTPSRSGIGTSTATPTTELEIDSTTDTSTVQGLPMQRSTSKGSQTDLPADASAVLDEIVEETFENATGSQASAPNENLPLSAVESERIRTRVESRPNSPGVDPRKAMPVLAEDAANLPERLVPHDEHHKAVTVHLPPREVQEQHLREVKDARSHRNERNGLSIHPPKDAARHGDVMSSPGSTIDAHSATTPAMHEASADTSPESRYEAERVEDKEDDVSTPPELKRSPEEVAEKEEHDRLLKARIDMATAEIMKDSPGEVGDQSQADEAVPGQSEQRGLPQTNVADRSKDVASQLVAEASQAVQDIVEDEDEVVGVPTPEDDTTAPEEPDVEARVRDNEKQPEVPDSEEDGTPDVDAMDVDTTIVKDSFESSNPTESAAATSPIVPAATEQPSKPAESSYSSVTPTAATPRRTPSTPAPAPVLERMTTRVASGAMRHKSVSEILGETPKPSSSNSNSGHSHSPSRSTTPQSPGARVRTLAEKQKEKERSKLSTVVFPGRGPKAVASETALLANGSPSQSLKDDYFMPLFIAGASTDKRGVPSLDALLSSAHKTITTSNSYVPLSENQTSKVLKRIYALQSSNKWSLRQPKRCPEPIRPTSHWDLVLQEAKWMRTDFREERKWKAAVARNLAYACAEWVESASEDRVLLQVKASAPKPTEAAGSSKDAELGESSSQAGTHPTPDLVAAEEPDSPMDDLDEEPRLNLLDTVAPTAIFALQDDDVVFGLRRSPTADKLLDELPMYGTPLMVPRSELPTAEDDPDRFWKRPALPLSKFVEGRMELKVTAPPRKKSRFEYDLEDDDEDQVVFGEPKTKRPILTPEQTDVALFNPEHKHIRDRIHSSHQFRPPSEFPMPQQTFFESRIASQWTWDEDNELKGHVRDYSYNWSLISSLLNSKSLYISGAERRTPWECFERWIHLEGLPADMQKTHYFRAYTSRIEAANRNVLAQNVATPQQPNANGQVQPAPRRRPTTSVRVERRRNGKHLTLVDAMRKLAKKRETSLQKQQHAAGMAAMRKANEAPHAANRNMLATTPQDFSKIKYERDEQFRERVAAMQQRQEANRRANGSSQQQMGRPVNPQQPGLPGGPPRPANSALPTNGSAPPSGQNLTVPGQNRPRPMPPQMNGQPMPNNLRVPQMPMNAGAITAQMGQLPPPNPALDVQLVARAQQISQHQQAIRLQQQNQGPGQSPQMHHNSPPRMNGMPQPGFPMQGNMMPPFNPNANPNGVSTPPLNSHMSPPVQGNAGSPRMVSSNLSQVPNMEQQIRARYPAASNEQIMSIMQAQINKSLQQKQTLPPNMSQNMAQNAQNISQNAMNAAAGSGAGSPMATMANVNGNGMNGMNTGQGTPQLYAQMLRQQQENQQKALQQQQQAVGLSPQNQGNGGNSAQGHAHRGSSGSAQSGK